MACCASLSVILGSTSARVVAGEGATFVVKVIGEGTVAALGDGFVSSVRVVVDIIGEVMLVDDEWIENVVTSK